MRQLLTYKIPPFTITAPIKTVFIVTSTLNPSPKKLSYAPVRSVFSGEERLAQTVATLESIRSKMPDALIMFCENSAITKEQAAAVGRRCDWFVSFANDPQAAKLRDQPNKGRAELYMLRQLLGALSPFAYERLFKIGGRYSLSDSFNADSFAAGTICGKRIGSSISTRLYAVPKSLEGLFAAQLEKTFKKCSPRIAIERLLFNDIDDSLFHQADPLGVTGRVSVNGILIDE